MNDKNKTTVVTEEYGISIVWILQIVFLILKLCGVIDWSWWWVFSPLWISVGLTLIIFIIVLIVMSYLLRDDEE